MQRKQKPQKKQHKKQPTKLQRAHLERGFRENSTTKHYHAYLVDSDGRTYVEDYDAKARVFAKQYFEEIAVVRGLKVVDIKAYQ